MTDVILNVFGIFKYVHPNLITLTGLVLNFCILYAITHEMFFPTVVMLVIRYLADCLDGGVARKYNKKSKIGGALDTWSDTILVYVSAVGIFYLFKIPYGSEVGAFLSCLNLYMMSLTDSLVDHAGMKVGGDWLSDIYAFLVNNSYILFFLKIVIIYGPMHTARIL